MEQGGYAFYATDADNILNRHILKQELFPQTKLTPFIMKAVAFIFAFSATLLLASTLPVNVKRPTSLTGDNGVDMHFDAYFARNLERKHARHMNEDYLTSKVSGKSLKKAFQKIKKILKKAIERVRRGRRPRRF